MKWNFKFWKDVRAISFAGVFLALMFIGGYFFEAVIRGEWMGTVINPSPVEGLIIVPLLVIGIFPSMLIAVLYASLILLTKGTSTNLIGETALIIAILTYLWGYVAGNAITRPMAKKWSYLKRGIVSAIIATILVTLVMFILNVIWISPSYVNGLRWTLVWNMDLQNYDGLWGWIKLVTLPPLGILHGNIIKYTLCSILAMVILKHPLIWSQKTQMERKSYRAKIYKEND